MGESVITGSAPGLRVDKFRNGRKVRVHLYVQRGLEPDDSDTPLVTMPTPEFADLVVRAVNAHLDTHPEDRELLE